MAWKTLKVIFEEEGLLNLNTPRLVVKEAYGAGLINDEDLWLTMLKDRNLTSHIYDEEVAIKISDNIRFNYADELTKIATVLEARIKNS